MACLEFIVAVYRNPTEHKIRLGQVHQWARSSTTESPGGDYQAEQGAAVARKVTHFRLLIVGRLLDPVREAGARTNNASFTPASYRFSSRGARALRLWRALQSVDPNLVSRLGQSRRRQPLFLEGLQIRHTLGRCR